MTLLWPHGQINYSVFLASNLVQLFLFFHLDIIFAMWVHHLNMYQHDPHIQKFKNNNCDMEQLDCKNIWIPALFCRYWWNCWCHCLLSFHNLVNFLVDWEILFDTTAMYCCTIRLIYKWYHSPISNSCLIIAM